MAFTEAHLFGVSTKINPQCPHPLNFEDLWLLNPKPGRTLSGPKFQKVGG